MAHKFAPQHWERLLSAERRSLLDPGQFLDRVAIPPGSVVADVGAGPGFFTRALAERVGARGTVYALDVAPEMVDRLRAQELPPQVVVRHNEESRLPLPDRSVDVVLLAFVLHELESPPALLQEIGRTLRPGGRLVVLEWVPQDEAMGPPRHERIAAGDSATLLGEAGFRAVDGGMVNPSHYYHVAVREAQGQE